MVNETLIPKLSQNRIMEFYLTLSVLFIIFSQVTAEADEVKLKNNKTFVGRITKEVVGGVWLEISKGAEVLLPASQIESIKKTPIEDKKDIEDRRDVKTPVQIVEAKEETQAKSEEDNPENRNEDIDDYFKNIKEITKKNIHAANDFTAKAKKLVEGLANNEIDLEGFEYMIKAEEKKRLDIEVKALDALKSVKPVPPRFEKSHTLLIESLDEETEALRSDIAGDKEAAQQHSLKALECAKKSAKDMGREVVGLMNDYMEKLDSIQKPK